LLKFRCRPSEEKKGHRSAKKKEPECRPAPPRKSPGKPPSKKEEEK